uniref:Uncharacterized protein n=1 Tax=Eutreptiella gymnastica TaxID=73025 RepID=A0A7S4D194_9EUGL
MAPQGIWWTGALAVPYDGEFPGCICANPAFPLQWQSVPCCSGEDWCGVQCQPCVIDAQCVNTTGECMYYDHPDGTACDDGDPDSSNDVCREGACEGEYPDDSDGATCLRDDVNGECPGTASNSY